MSERGEAAPGDRHDPAAGVGRSRVRSDRSSLAESVPWRDEELAELRAQVAYWRENYKILVRIIAEQHEDPALHWLDQIVHTRFSKLL